MLKGADSRAVCGYERRTGAARRQAGRPVPQCLEVGLGSFGVSGLRWLCGRWNAMTECS